MGLMEEEEEEEEEEWKNSSGGGYPALRKLVSDIPEGQRW